MSSSSPPNTRRRRILNAVTSIKPSKGKKPNTFFQPIQDPSDQYQIQVTRDGSMITAVPISKDSLRSSPILYSDACDSSDSPSQNKKNVVRKQSFSKQSLLEARGKQRSKLKSQGGSTNVISSNFGNDVPFKPVKSKSHLQKQKRTGVRWDLTQVNDEQRKSDTNKFNTQTKDDDSLSSFPMLSPNHKFEEDVAAAASSRGVTNKVRATGVENGNSPKSRQTPSQTTVDRKGQILTAHPKSPTSPASPSDTTTSSNSFQNLMQQRIAEIQSEQFKLKQSITEKEMIERTLVSAIDDNLEKNRKRISDLDNELQEIQWHLSLNPKNGQGGKVRKATQRSNVVSPSESVGDPSISMIDSVNDSIISARDMKRNNMEKTVSVTGLDPPARPSPSPPKISSHKKQDPMGPRLSAVLRGDEVPAVYGFNNVQGQKKHLSDIPIRPIRPLPRNVGNMQRTRQQHLVSQQQKAKQQQQQQNIPQTANQKPSINQLTSRRIKSILNAGSRRGIKKNVQFNLPDEHEKESEELKFVNGSPTDDSFMLSQARERNASMNGHFKQGLGGGNNPNYHRTNVLSPPSNGQDEIRFPMEVDQVDDQSWQGSLYDIDTFDQTSGNLISSEHYDNFQWRDADHHVISAKHYSVENHHNLDDSKGHTASAFEQYSRNGGVSSDSVETDPDLGFIHAVAAVVIQTAVRRLLAEIRAMERLYAVQVIQTAICQWMARQTDPNLQTYRVVRKGVSYMPSPVRVHPTKMKRVMFQDVEQSQLYHGEATNIQRCYRGWWSREGIGVDHFAAVQIQRVFRGWWQREALEVDKYCAVEIQRVIRGYLGRMSYIYDLYCVIVAQSMARRYLAFYESAIRLANVLYIQAIYRGYRVRSELMRYVLQGQEVAATMIQAQFRAYDAEMNYVNTLADILIVQSVARRWLTLRKLKQGNLQRSSYNGTRRQQQSVRNNGSISRAIKNLKQYPDSRQHHVQQNGSSSQWQSYQTYRSQTQKSTNRPPIRHENKIARSNHRLQTVVHHPDSSYTVNRGGSDEWYDGNKSEASEMLTNWKRRNA